MMNARDIEKLADLARLKLTESECKALLGDIDAILAYVSEVTTIAAAPRAEASSGPMREDGSPHETGAYTEKLLAAAPHRADSYVEVKNILPRA